MENHNPKVENSVLKQIINFRKGRLIDMNRADIRNYSIERNHARASQVSDDMLVRFAQNAKYFLASFFASRKVRLVAACIGFIAFLLGTVGFAAGVDSGSISFVYVLPFLAALLGVSFVMLNRGEGNGDER